MRTRMVLLALLLLGAISTKADLLLAYWDFGPDAAGYTESVTIDHVNGTPELTGMPAGTGYDPDGQEGIAFTDVEGTDHPAGQALAWGSGVNDGDQFWDLSIDLTGYRAFTLRWDYRATATGPSAANLYYRIGTNDWNLIDSVSFIRDAVYHAWQKDLSSFTALNSQSNVTFRLTGFSGGSGSGTWRMDNLQLTAASLVPEPASVSIWLISMAGMVFIRRLFKPF